MFLVRGKRRALPAMALLAAMVPTLGFAQNIDASDPEQLANLARGFGSATLEKGSDGDPMIRGRINGVGYAIFFYGCENGENCRSLNFYAGWDVPGVTEAQIGEWNATKRFSRAYLDKEGEPALEMDVNLHGGVSTANFEDNLDWWRVLLDTFKTEVVEKAP